ncbi:hypothetical protein N0V83_003232 [Neocucurbitaria cava]|uniref:Heterokaryon incompatibility domain-containing protein n=1 Tax=Neocucurbitaria cava TaxID=798079 RepID=A0A9W8YBV5_9PLEO|nr:hypothetical protein N0V83_003232 [Neocucurbitaria cava]
MFRKFKGNIGNVIGMEHIMRHNWWCRMWTFQEFVLAERPVLVVGKNQRLWDDLVVTANNTFFSTDARDDMVRRKRQNAKADELVINNNMPPDEAEVFRGMEISIHLVPLWKNIMNAHKGRVTYQLGLQDPQLIASDFLLEARTRPSGEPKDKLYELYYILQACHYSLPSIDYSETIEKIYEDVTFSIVNQSKSWWILSHLLRARETYTLELSSWVPELCSQILWHQRMELFKEHAEMVASEGIQWPQNHFYLERLADGAICTSAIFPWTVTSSSSILSPTRALDKSFEAYFEEARYGILLKASEDFLFTMANWLNLMTNPDYGDPAGTDSQALEIQDTTPHILRAISRTFFRAASVQGHLLAFTPLESSHSTNESTLSTFLLVNIQQTLSETANSNVMNNKRGGGGGGGRPIYGPNGTKLKQVQYWSYMHDIDLFHFQAYFATIHMFRTALSRQDHGYVDTLFSNDPVHDLPVPEGDEVPADCVEVAYMRGVFQRGGSALGFRVGKNVVEWMCFDRALDDIILTKLETNRLNVQGSAVMLFDHVANVPRGVQERRVRGTTTEHRSWHVSLCLAGNRPVKVYLTWKTFGTELQQHHALQRMAYMESEQAMSALIVDDEGLAEHWEGEEEEEEEEVEEDTDEAEKYEEGCLLTKSTSYDNEDDIIMADMPNKRPFIYKDESMHDTSLKKIELPHKPSVTGSTVLREKDTNTLPLRLAARSDEAQGKQLPDDGQF